MQLIHFVAFVALLGAAYAQPVDDERLREAARVAFAYPTAQLGNPANSEADQPEKEENKSRPRRWLWGGIGGWGGGWNRGWSGGNHVGWGGGWTGGNHGGWGSGWGSVSYQPWSSGSSYWW